MGFVHLAQGDIAILQSVNKALRKNLGAYVPVGRSGLVISGAGRRCDDGTLRPYGLATPSTAHDPAPVLRRRAGAGGYAGISSQAVANCPAGEKNVCFFARAIAQDGQVILLDEPLPAWM